MSSCCAWRGGGSGSAGSKAVSTALTGTESPPRPSNVEAWQSWGGGEEGSVTLDRFVVGLGPALLDRAGP
eukprot:jgi/Botrbrau1/22556/Bobra.0731s0001.1